MRRCSCLYIRIYGDLSRRVCWHQRRETYTLLVEFLCSRLDTRYLRYICLDKSGEEGAIGARCRIVATVDVALRYSGFFAVCASENAWCMHFVAARISMSLPARCRYGHKRKVEQHNEHNGGGHGVNENDEQA